MTKQNEQALWTAINNCSMSNTDEYDSEIMGEYLESEDESDDNLRRTDPQMWAFLNGSGVMP